MGKGGNIAAGLIIGLIAGGLGGYAVFYFLNPTPTIYTLTIVDYEQSSFEYIDSWLPNNPGVYFDAGPTEVVTIQFNAGTNVTLVCGASGLLVSFTGNNSADVTITNHTHAWIVMDGNKIIDPYFT